jgi:hypothetical protein
MITHKAVILLATSAAMALTGQCSHAADWSTESVLEESAFQAVHLIDLQQTLDIAKHPRMFERANVFDAGWAIGDHPSDRSVYAFMAGEAVLHAGVTVLLARYCSAWSVRLWEATTISLNGLTVAHNAHIGLAVRL